MADGTDKTTGKRAKRGLEELVPARVCVWCRAGRESHSGRLWCVDGVGGRAVAQGFSFLGNWTGSLPHPLNIPSPYHHHHHTIASVLHVDSQLSPEKEGFPMGVAPQPSYLPSPIPPPPSQPKRVKKKGGGSEVDLSNLPALLEEKLLRPFIFRLTRTSLFFGRGGGWEEIESLPRFCSPPLVSSLSSPPIQPTPFRTMFFLVLTPRDSLVLLS